MVERGSCSCGARRGRAYRGGGKGGDPVGLGRKEVAGRRAAGQPGEGLDPETLGFERRSESLQACETLLCMRGRPGQLCRNQTRSERLHYASEIKEACVENGTLAP